VTRGTRPKKTSSSRGFAREARGARGVRGVWGKPKIENWKKILSFQAGNNYQKFLFIYLFIFFASMRTRFLLRRWAVKTHPRGKRGRGRTSGRKGRPDGNFPPKSSFMTSLGYRRPWFNWTSPGQGRGLVSLALPALTPCPSPALQPSPGWASPWVRLVRYPARPRTLPGPPLIPGPPVSAFCPPLCKGWTKNITTGSRTCWYKIRCSYIYSLPSNRTLNLFVLLPQVFLILSSYLVAFTNMYNERNKPR
jgi:hypothetical protein